jgi:hypothetical protein
VVQLLLLLLPCRTTCPNCLSLPAISLLQKISNHLDLVRPDARLREVDERQVGFRVQTESFRAVKTLQHHTGV